MKYPDIDCEMVDIKSESNPLTVPISFEEEKPADLTDTILENLSRKELGYIAKVLKVSVGKSRKDTIQNLHTVISQGKAQFQLKVIISKPPELGQNHANAFFIKTLKSYQGNSTVVEAMKFNQPWKTPLASMSLAQYLKS